jgi:hypothetical protein
MKRCAHCDRPIGLVNYKRWGDFYFCCKNHVQTYCFARQQDSRIAQLLQWLGAHKGRKRGALS